MSSAGTGPTSIAGTWLATYTPYRASATAIRSSVAERLIRTVLVGREFILAARDA
jgi:hypothetical protein